LVHRLVFSLELGARGCHFGHPRVVAHGRGFLDQHFQRGFLVADDTDFDRQVAADVFRSRVNV
jgi:hypothetical protein